MATSSNGKPLPDYHMMASRRSTGALGVVGAAWKNEDGTIGIRLNPFAQPLVHDTDVVLTLQPIGKMQRSGVPLPPAPSRDDGEAYGHPIAPDPLPPQGRPGVPPRFDPVVERWRSAAVIRDRVDKIDTGVRIDQAVKNLAEVAGLPRPPALPWRRPPVAFQSDSEVPDRPPGWSYSFPRKEPRAWGLAKDGRVRGFERVRGYIVPATDYRPGEKYDNTLSVAEVIFWRARKGLCRCPGVYVPVSEEVQDGTEVRTGEELRPEEAARDAVEAPELAAAKPEPAPEGPAGG